MLDVHQLKVFASVADNLSFTRAAERLFLTQSAVGHQIARLEREVGCQLLERHGRTVSLTAAGRQMAQHARRVFGAIDEAVAAAKNAGRIGAGRLRIGASSAACQYIIPQAVRLFSGTFPQYSLSITPDDSPQTADRLAAGEIDLGLMLRLDAHRKLSFHDLFEDELQFLVSPRHLWAQAKKVDRRELANQQMVLYSRRSATFRIVERYFLKMRAPLHDWIELGDMGAIKELVKLGLGVSVTAAWTSRPEIAERALVLLPPPGARLRRKWCIASPAGKSLSTAEKAFIDACQAASRALIARSPDE